MTNVKNVGFDLPADLGAENKKIQRQRQMAQLLQQQSLTPDQGQMVGGHYVAPSPLSALAKMLTVGMTNKKSEQLDQQEAALGKKSQQMLIDGLQGYQKTLQGEEAQQFKVLDDEYGEQTATAPAVPGNKQAALAQLLQSGHPMLQEFGMKQMMAGPGKFSTTPQYDQSGRAFVMSEDGQVKYLDGIKARDEIINDNGFHRTKFNTTPIGVAPADPNKPFNIGPDGKPVANTAYQDYEVKKAKSGASNTNVSVNTEKNLLNGVASGVAGSIVDARGAAQAAAASINTVGRLNDALNSGNVIAGPGATFKQFGLQVGNMLGINGKDENDKLLNTRQAIQSLAQLELDAAQQMKGQGQITENERAIIRRAAAGEINDMTSDELRVLVGVLDRTARYKIQTYQDQARLLQSNPDAAPIAPFLNVDMPPALQGPQAAPTSNAAAAPQGVRRYNPQTGRIE